MHVSQAPTRVIRFFLFAFLAGWFVRSCAGGRPRHRHRRHR